MKTWMRRIAYLLLTLILVLNILSAFHAYRFTHFYEGGRARDLFRPETAGTLDKAEALLFGIKSYKRPLDSIPTGYDTLSLFTDDGLRLEAWSSRPVSNGGKRGTVILFHGHGGNKAGVLAEAGAFNALGYSTLQVDFRAHGNSAGNDCTIGYREALDVKAAYDFVAAEGEDNIILWGISLGAAAEMKAVADYHLKPSKMILEMPFGSLLEAVRGRCRLLGVPEEPVATLLTFWGGVEQGFWAFDHNPQDYAKRITCPVLLQWGAKDNRVSQAETDVIFRNLAGPGKSLVTYSYSGHQSLCLNEKEKWVSTVASFLNR